MIDDHQGLLLQADIEGIPKVMVMNIKFPHWSMVILGTWSSGDYRLLDGGACVTHADTNLKVLMVMVVMVSHMPTTKTSKKALQLLPYPS